MESFNMLCMESFNKYTVQNKFQKLQGLVYLEMTRAWLTRVLVKRIFIRSSHRWKLLYLLKYSVLIKDLKILETGKTLKQTNRHIAVQLSHERPFKINNVWTKKDIRSKHLYVEWQVSVQGHCGSIRSITLNLKIYFKFDKRICIKVVVLTTAKTRQLNVTYGSEY